MCLPKSAHVFFVAMVVVLCALLAARFDSLKAQYWDEESFDSDDYFDHLGETPRRETLDGNTRALPLENFGSGVTTTSIGSLFDGARATAIQSDGKVLAAGNTDNGSSSDVAVVRFNPDGSIDTSFFTNGKSTTTFGNLTDIIHAILLQTNGTLLAVGRTDVTHGYSSFALARLLSNGSLDTAFHTDGKVTTGIQTSGVARAAFLQTDGNIVVTGYTSNATKWDFAIARYLTDGSLDTAFATDGTQHTAVSANNNASFAAFVQTDGLIIAAGGNYNSSDWDFAVTRYGTDGALDTSFFTNGKFTGSITSSADEIAYAVGVDINARVVVGGSSVVSAGNVDMASLRLNASGSLDTSYGTDGKATTAIGSADEKAFAIGLQSDAKPIFAGFSNNGSNDDFAIVRYKTDGSLDTSFSTSGKKTTAVGAASEVAQGMAMLADGSIFIAGRSTDATSSSTNYDIAVARYSSDGSLGGAGSLNKSFATNGIYRSAIGGFVGVGEALAVATDGKLIVIGEDSAGGAYRFGMIRLFPQGILDTSFHTNGTLLVTFGTSNNYPMGVAIQTDGKMIEAGHYINTAGDNDWAVTRVHTDGTFDTSFFTAGTLVHSMGTGSTGDRVYGTGLQTDGKFLLSGDYGGGLFALARYQSDGALDTSFATTGKKLVGSLGQVRTVMYLSNQKIVAAGDDVNNHASLFRMESSGAFDTSFHTDGVSIVAAYTNSSRFFGMNVDSAGILTAAGSLYNGTKLKFGIGRFLTSGSLDTTFDTDGALLIALGTHHDSATFGAIVPGSKFMIGGYSSNTVTNDVGLARILSNGALDTSFKTTGYTVEVTASDDYAYGGLVAPDGAVFTAGYPGFYVMKYWP